MRNDLNSLGFYSGRVMVRIHCHFGVPFVGFKQLEIEAGNDCRYCHVKFGISETGGFRLSDNGKGTKLSEIRGAKQWGLGEP